MTDDYGFYRTDEEGNRIGELEIESVKDSEEECPVCGSPERGITDEVLFICEECGTTYREVSMVDDEGNKIEYRETQIIERGDDSDGE